MTPHTTITSPLGDLLLVGEETADGITLTSLSMPGQKNAPAIRPGWPPDAEPFAEIIRQLEAYFAGELTRFDIRFTSSGTDFQQRIWHAPQASSARYDSSHTKAPCNRPSFEPGNPLAMIDTSRSAGPVAGRVAESDWTALTGDLNAYGNALTGQILTPAECRGIARDWATKLGKPAPGRRACTSGFGCATRPGSPSPRRSCCGTAPATGTLGTATCSATCSSPSRSSSASTRLAQTSPAASS